MIADMIDREKVVVGVGALAVVGLLAWAMVASARNRVPRPQIPPPGASEDEWRRFQAQVDLYKQQTLSDLAGDVMLAAM